MAFGNSGILLKTCIPCLVKRQLHSAGLLIMVMKLHCFSLSHCTDPWYAGEYSNAAEKSSATLAEHDCEGQGCHACACCSHRSSTGCSEGAAQYFILMIYPATCNTLSCRIVTLAEVMLLKNAACPACINSRETAWSRLYSILHADALLTPLDSGSHTLGCLFSAPLMSC